MNPLDSRPKLREVAYLVQWITNLFLGIVSIVLVALHDNPLWWVIVQAVFNFVWTYLGITAKNNVSYNEYETSDAYVEPEVEDAEPTPVNDATVEDEGTVDSPAEVEDPEHGQFVDQGGND